MTRQSDSPHIRPATIEDRPVLLSIWERSVRATHTFLSEADIQRFLPLVRDVALVKLETWVLIHNGRPAGFMGMNGNQIDALFIDPDHHRRGFGRALIQHAQSRHAILLLDVNEQNPNARQFYEATGFTLIGRSEVDGQGNPFPLLHMRKIVAPAD